MKSQRIIYVTSTGILTAIMLFSAFNFFFHRDRATSLLAHFDYPVYMVHPLAVAKVVGLVAIWGDFSSWLREWSYAGFFFGTLMAFFAHFITDGEGYLISFFASIATIVSYVMARHLRA